ncbi:methyltransferase domain-containing protein [Akkermansiaceae bacterium]|nr:methyltransferase domain-containing protein [Akkermansiaceae bacterium]
MTNNINIVCPHCVGELTEARSESVTCLACDASFEVVDNIPVLRTNPDTYYGEFPKDEMHHVLRDARGDLDGTIRKYLRKKDAPSRLGEYILGKGRAGWQYLLPLDRESKVLDLGCGWGTLAWSLAQFCGHVTACDSTLERMQLLGLRKENDKLDNLQLVCAGDSKHLPFPDNSFDAVVINGVLEWVPSGLPGNPREVQKAFLREVRRVLSPSGCLFLGIENRNAWKTWAMNKDGHTGLRFVPWMPRLLAHAYSRLNGKGSYRNYLYSPSQYRKLLQQCGFENTRFQVPHPGYHHPTRMIGLDRKSQLRQAFTRLEKTPFLRFRQKVKSFLSSHFPDAFGVITSGAKSPPYLEELISHVQSEVFNEAEVVSDQYNYRMNGEMGIVTVLVSHPAKPFVLKLPLHDRGLEELRAEADILAAMASEENADSNAVFAEILARGEFKGQEYFVHSLFPGVSGDKFVSGSKLFNTAIENVAKFLGEHHSRPNGGDATLEKVIESVKEKVLTLAVDASQKEIVERISGEVLEKVPQLGRGAIPSHGDSKLANFMFDPATASLTGVIDWGTGFQPELPGYDLSFLFVSSECTRTKSSLPNQLKQQHEYGVPAHLKSVLKAFTEQTKLQIDDATYRAIIGYQWMRRLAPLAGDYETARFDHRYLDQMFDAMRSN